MKLFLISTLIVSSLVAGCVAGKPIGEGQACPCVPGWTCDEGAGVCVPDTSSTGAAGTGGGGGMGAPAGGGMSGSEDPTLPVAPGCEATCGTPAGEVEALNSIDVAYAVLHGRWAFCDTVGRTPMAPPDAIGVDFALGMRDWTIRTSPISGKMYYLVAGPNGPERGRGFAYQAEYEITGEGLTYWLNLHPTPNVGFNTVLRYSPCPHELEVNFRVDVPGAIWVRFEPGAGVTDAGVDAAPSTTDATPNGVDL